MQDVLKHGCEGLRAKITGLVVKNLVILSLDRYGTHVAQACFPGVAAGGLPLLVQLRLPCALKEFLFLSEARLEQLVEDKYASYVVRKLLVSGKNVSIQLPPCHVCAGPEPSLIHPQLPAVSIRVE